MKIKHLIFLPLILLISACSKIIPMNSGYYESPTTVGIIVVSDDIGVARMGNQGALTFVTSTRFMKGLRAVQDNVNPTSELVKMYQKIFDMNGKQHVLIEDETFINKFSGTFKYSNGYSKRDFAMLKEKYGIDEILFVKASYGLLVKYGQYSRVVAEIGKAGFCQINAQIVDINSRKLKYRSSNIRYKKMTRKWDSSGNYAYLEENIWEAIVLTAKIERQAMLAIGN